MKKIKIILTLSIILSIGLVVAGCGAKPSPSNTDNNSASSNKENKPIPVPSAAVKMKDQYGKEYSLGQFKGKTVFLNFFASWCGPCLSEIEDIQKLYEQHGKNANDVIVIGIANPSKSGLSSKDSNSIDVSQEEIMKVLDKYKITYPILFDENREIFDAFRVKSFPTTFTFREDNTVFGVVNGAMNYDTMENAIAQTKKGKQ